MEKKENKGIEKILGIGIVCLFIYLAFYFLNNNPKSIEEVIEKLTLSISIGIALSISYAAYTSNKKEK